ncbi:MAG: CRTAC1 family protein [Planctomycetales bacterium]|nr:CRTAC1 family protein [Planctomycetales bacterium]
MIRTGRFLFSRWDVHALFAFAFQMTATFGVAQDLSFRDVSDNSNIQFQHTDGSTGKHYLIESMSAGLALLDFDRDGDLDIYFLNGALIDPDAAAKPTPDNDALYRNGGDFQFSDATNSAVLTNTAMGLGIACADYDNDGFVDIYVNNYGPNLLYHNNGDGTFSDQTLAAGVGNGVLVGGGVSFFDKEMDGDLDLYVANYIQFDPATHRPHVHKGLPAYPSPLSSKPEPDTLYENNGDGTFTDCSVVSGVRAVAGRGMGLVTFDYDGDHDIDILVANDTQENFVFENDGNGIFSEVGLLAGLAYDFRGKPQASMGIELLDFNGDGLQDLCLTSFSEEFVTLYENLGGGLFNDVTLRSGSAEATFPHVTWGVVAFDADNDTNMDLLIAAGDLDDRRGERGGSSTSTQFRVSNLLLQGNGKGKFVDQGMSWGTAAAVTESTRGAVANDLNGDGRVDAVLLNSRARPTILKNESPGRAWIEIDLVGISCSRSALGAEITVQQHDISQTQHVVSGHSYQSDSSARVHFGLTNELDPVHVIVRWPGGDIPIEYVLNPCSLATLVERMSE